MELLADNSNGLMRVQVSGAENATLLVSALESSPGKHMSKVMGFDITPDNLVDHIIGIIRIYSARLRVTPDEIMDRVNAEVNSNDTVVRLD